MYDGNGITHIFLKKNEEDSALLIEIERIREFDPGDFYSKYPTLAELRHLLLRLRNEE